MTAPRPAGNGEKGWCLNCNEWGDPDPRRAHPAAECPWRPQTWLATPSEPTVEAELAELAVLRQKIANVRAMRDAAVGDTVTKAAINHALGDAR